MERRIIGGHEPPDHRCVGPGVPPHVARVGDRSWSTTTRLHGCVIAVLAGSVVQSSHTLVYSVNAHGSHAPFMKVPGKHL